MNLTALAVKRPVTILMIVFGLLVMGAVSYGFLPVRELPDMPQPDIEVSTAYPGASPADVRRLITEPLQNGLRLVNGITTMTSISSQGESSILLRFSAGIGSDTAATDVAQAIHRVSGKLPKAAALPTIIQRNPADIPMMALTLGGNMSSGQLAQYATDNLYPALQSVPGVAGVAITGASMPRIDVTVDADRLAAYGVTLGELSRAIASQTGVVPGGTLQNGANAYMTSTETPYANGQSLSSIVIAAPKTTGSLARPIRLGDVAEVSQSLAESPTRTTADGETAVGVTIGVQNGANSLQVEQGVLAQLKTLKKALPPGIRLTILSDTTLETKAALRAVVTDLLLAIALTSLILYLFLRRAAHTLIVLLAIPTSLIATFAVMYGLGFSLDLMSLLGLSLLIGILVDDSIVVLENIDRHLSAGEPPRDAAIRGRLEIGAAAVAITLTDVVVYAPVAFVHGTAGQLFREFGLTIVAATLFSLFISFTLTPMLASRWLRRENRTAPVPAADRSRLIRTGNRIGARYEAAIGRALDRRGWIAGMACVCLAASLLFVPLGIVPTSLLPSSNPSLVQIVLTLPPGTASAETDKTVQAFVRDMLAQVPNGHIYAIGGQAGDGTFASNTATLSVIRPPEQLTPTASDIMRRARELDAGLPGVSIRTELPNPLVAGGTPPVDVIVAGDDPALLSRQALEVEKRLQGVNGLTEVHNGLDESMPEWAIRIDESKADRFHLTTTEIGQAVQQAVQGNTVATLQPTGSGSAEGIFVQLRDGSQLTPERMRAIPVARVSGYVVLLGDVASIELQPGPVQLAEQNNRLAAHITANVVGITTGQADREIRQALAGLDAASGYDLQIGGQIADQKLAFGPLTLALVLSIILIYMLMAALYESFVTPMVVLLSLPLATVGALVGLAVTGQSMNLFSFIAMIMLTGLVAKNAILLVDRTTQLIGQGAERRTALIQAAQTRLRPIMMTTATMVISMLPLALDHGVGSANRIPVAIVLIGGMSTSTLLTLFVVPVLYTYLDDLRVFLRAKRTSTLVREVESS